MRNIKNVALAGMLVNAIGCIAGDNSLPCTTSVPTDNVCYTAQHLAIRDSESLLVKQETVQRYYERYSRALAKEPLLLALPTDKFLYGALESASDRIGAAWLQGSLVAGVEPIDSALATVANRIRTASRLSDGSLYELTFTAEKLYSPRIMSDSVGADSRVPYDGSFGGLWPDIHLTWSPGSPAEGSDDSTAIIDMGFAVSGDCFVGCDQHFLRAVVTPTETTVYDRGGEPLPAGFTPLQSTTIPWPGP
jgi:hypothetical protein